MFQIGRFDIIYAVTSLNLFSAAPREGYLKHLLNIFGHLQNSTGRQKGIVISQDYIREIGGRGVKTTYWIENYPSTM